MGWWSTDIMGGDTPLDIECFIYDILEVQQFVGDTKTGLTKEHFADPYEIIQKIGQMDDGYWLKGDDGNIFYQVLGVLMMKAGAPIETALKAKMINAAHKDEWADEDEERKQRMSSFVDALNRYDGTEPFVIKSAGLFDRINVGIITSNPKVEMETLRGLLLAHVEDYRHDSVNEILDKIIEKAKE